MKTESLWQAESAPPQFPLPPESITVDVLIIGGGITGVTSAHLLKEAGCTVALVDLYKVGGGETSHTTAHLTYVTDARLNELVSKHGRQEAQAFWEAGLFAMQQIETIASTQRIECGLGHVPGFLFAAEEKDAGKERESLRKDADLALEMGFDAQYIDSVSLFQRPGVRFANQLKFQPLDYLFGLAQKIPGKGSYILEESDGSELDDKKRELRLKNCTVHYKSVVIATHVPLQGSRGTIEAALFQTKLAAYSTYAIEATLKSDPLAEALYWDTRDPYYYYRFDRKENGYSVILGGEDHKTGQESDTVQRYATLEKVLHKHFPGASIKHRWSGQVLETPDGLPYIGECAERQYLATGFSGNGITLGTFSAMLIRDLITGRKNPWTELFSPGRKRLAGVWEYLRENKDFPLYLAKDYLTPAKADEEGRRNHGEVLKVDGKKCAVFCDAHGKKTTLSAVCPHMGCIVHWNGAEKTWDCPCHGSRFTAMGDLISGPAETGLEKVAG